MARLAGLDPSQVAPDITEHMRQQAIRHGRPSEESAIMARRPSIARAYAAMFAAIDASGLLPKTLRTSSTGASPSASAVPSEPT